MENCASFLTFFITIPLCSVLLWFWTQMLQGKAPALKSVLIGLCVLLLSLLLIVPLSYVRYLPNFTQYQGLFFTNLNLTFNASLIVYIVLNFRRPWSRRLLPVSIGFMVLNVFLSYSLSVLRNCGSGLGIQLLVFTIQGLYIYLFVAMMDGFHISRNVMTWSIIALTKDLAANVYHLLQNLRGINDMTTNALFPGIPLFATCAIQLLFYLGVYGLVACVAFKAGRNSADITVGRSALIGIVVLLVTGPLYAIIRNYQQISIPISICLKFLYIVIYVLLLNIRFKVNRQAALDSELMITRQLMRQEQKHYQEVRDSIDLVNMRCHDINRQLQKLQSKLTCEELASLQEAVKIYDSNIHTGSEICDMVLYQKELFCKDKGIRLSYIIDGASLRFMSGSDLYALLSNLLDNAIEAVIKLGNPEKWIVDLTVSVQSGTVVIETNNFFDVDAYDAAARTSKPDPVHHGYGLKSIRYIVSEYNGTIHISSIGDVFTVRLCIPIPKA